MAELIRYRLRNERYIVRAGESRIQTRYGEFRMIAYESEVNGGESHIALVRGELCKDCPAFPNGLGSAGIGSPAGAGRGDGLFAAHAVLVRVHTRCTAGDVFAADCHCRETLDQSMRMIAEEGCGVVLYLHNTSRGFEIDRAAAPAEAFEPGGAAALPAAQQATQRPAYSAPGTARARRLAGAQRADSAGHRPGRPDPVGPGHSAHPPAVEYAHAHSGAGRLWAGDRRAGADSGGGVQPGSMKVRGERNLSGLNHV